MYNFLNDGSGFVRSNRRLHGPGKAGSSRSKGNSKTKDNKTKMNRGRPKKGATGKRIKRTIATKLDVALWAKSKKRAVKQLGGKWSARAAQLAVHFYKKAGGRYAGKKDTKKNSLVEWTREKWRTKSGKKSSETGERYLPEKIIKKLPADVYRRSTLAKRKASKRGIQWSKQPAKARQLVKKWRKRLHYD